MEGVKCGQKLKVLSEDQLDRIHEASLKILERTGVRYDSPDAVTRLVKNGASLKPGTTGVVTFPRGIVEESLRKVPRFRTYYARNPKNDLVWDGEHVFAGSLGGNPAILDLDTSEPRLSTLNDVVDTTRIMDALPNCHSISNMVVAADVPAEVQVVKTMDAMIRNTDKCVSSYALNAQDVDTLAEMWGAVAGGLEPLRKRPLFIVYGSPTSPLTFDQRTCEMMIKGAEYGVPIDIVPCPMSGGTAPVTIAGGLAQQHAEILSGIMLYQTVNDKLPTCYCGRLSSLDLRTGGALWGNAELALASSAAVQLAHRYGIGADVYGVTSDVSYWGMQMGMELMMTAIVPALAGADMLSGIGGAWGTASSYEMLVIDDDLYGEVFRVVQGIAVDDDRLGVDVIDRAGPMGNFLAQPHTMKYFREGELRVSPLWDKRSFDKVKSEGAGTLEARARDEARKIMKEHIPQPLERDVDKALADIVRKAIRDRT